MNFNLSLLIATQAIMTPNEPSAEQLALVRFVELSIECLSDSLCTPTEDEFEKKLALDHYADILRSLRAGPKARSVIKQIKADASTPWNELSFSKTATFWERVSKAKLPFRRRDAASEALVAGRIRNREEYEAIVDSIDLQTTQDQEKLEAMIDEFERRGSRRPKSKK